MAPHLEALLAHAHADGVPLGGWGHRTIESQIRLRERHCGPTPEDIWVKPAAECSPPTARPGASMHERGLAVDFHLGGQSIGTRSSPGYRWLAEHAATYGFYNLPSEPWHWSVNGQ
jgi:LAS superfamily LD-carboxypeptidase LdcB